MGFLAKGYRDHGDDLELVPEVLFYIHPALLRYLPRRI